MKRAKALLSFLLAAVMCLSLLAACGNSDSDTEGGEGGGDVEYMDTIIYSMTATPDGGFIPATGLTDYDSGICQLIHASMMTPNSEGILEPYLADSCEISEDGTVYTYHLREGVKWSDGEEVNADDVVFTFTLSASPDNDGQYATPAGYIKGVEEYRAGTADTIEGIRVIDNYTVEFTTTQYFSKAEAYFGQLQIMPEHIWKDIPYTELYNVDREMQDYPVCCGPYRVTELVVGEYVKLEANEDFFLGAPLTKNLIIKVVNSESISAELQSGAVDIADVTNLTSSELATLESQGFDITGYYYDLFQCAVFNKDREFSDDFRKAVFYAIDRQGIVDTLLDGRGTVIDLIMSAASWAYPDDFESPARDVDKAKAYLEAAGYVDVNGDGYVEDPNGEEFIFDLYFPLGLAAREQSAVVIQNNLGEIGIKVELSSYDFTAFWSAVGEGDYEMYLMGLGVDSVDPDPSNFVAYMGFESEAAQVCAQAASTIDRTERKALYKKLAEIQLETMPAITLYCQERTFAYPASLINYTPGTYNPYYNAYLWAIEK
ncbi:MAG: ABC transporter substrate-binding protein [Oscillospiraceae bacterium]